MTSLRSRLLPLLVSLLVALPAVADAWQQRVFYTMDVRLSPEERTLVGRQRLVYYNNSPDTITYVYYHLFYRAFRSGSMFFRLNRTEEQQRLDPRLQGDVRIDTLSQDGAPLRWTIDETIARVELDHPVLPGDSTVLEMSWFTRIPILIRRGGYQSPEGIEFSMAQWYPKIAAYDQSGWHPDIYVKREFYGVFGSYRVSITLPAQYVVAATGTLLNPEVVRCGYEFSNRDTVILYPASGTGVKTWVFQADSVHDFAWSADPDYFHEITHVDGVTIHLLAERNVRGYWTSAAGAARSIMAYYSRRFGNYAWPSFTIAQGGDGGMEYPMIVLVTGYRTEASLAGVIAHETAHQWFYGMLGNNETDEAWLDEGFAEYLTDQAKRDTLGIIGTEHPYTGLNRLVYPWWFSPYTAVESYYRLALLGLDEPLSTPHDRFLNDASSALVYHKGHAVLGMLQTMLGDSVFDEGMRRYVRAWRWRHPTTRDFEREMERTSGMRLDWFFNQWITLGRHCDYSLDALSSVESADGWTTEIEMSRDDGIAMPLIVELTYASGTAERMFVPIDLWRRPDIRLVGPRWDWVDRKYHTAITTPEEVVSAVIDPDGTLLDLDRTDNRRNTGLFGGVIPGAHVAFYRRWDLNRPPDAYSIRLRPLLWYSHGDGAEVGMIADGGYTFDRYRSRASLAYNVRSGNFDYDLSYATPVQLFGSRGEVQVQAAMTDGLRRMSGRLQSGSDARSGGRSSPQGILSVSIDYEHVVGPDIPNVSMPWEEGDFTSVGLSYTFDARSPRRHATFNGSIGVESAVATRRPWTEGRLQTNSRLRLYDFDLLSELFIGTSIGDLPLQRRFTPAGSASRTTWLDPISRLATNADPTFAGRNRILLPGEGFLFSLLDAEPRQPGRSIINTRLSVGGFQRLVAIRELGRVGLKEIRVYGALGWVLPGDISLQAFGSPVSTETGISAYIDLTYLLPPNIIDLLELPSPLTLSLHLPLTASSPMLKEREDRRYRLVIGVSSR